MSLQDKNSSIKRSRKIRLHKLVLDLVNQSLSLDYSKANVYKNIEKYGVKINDTTFFSRLQWIYLDQKVDISHWPKQPSQPFQQVQVLFENQNLLAVFKPKGVVVESGSGHLKENLLNWLQKKYPKNDLQLVHRLDKDTQGILIIAKNSYSLEFLQNQFRYRKVVKKYLALVDGLVDKNYVIHNWQARSKQNIVKQKLFWSEKEAMDYDENARKAISFIKPLFFCQQQNMSIVEVQIKTGRMHQIRLQCEALSFPLIQEKLYNSKLASTFFTSNSKFTSDIETLNKVFYSIKNIVCELDQLAFDQLKSRIFAGSEYGLLSNYIKLKIDLKTVLELQIFNFHEL